MEIVRSDLKAGDGVHKAEVRAQLKAVAARCVVCCNIFEQVTDREGFAAICDDILMPGGQIIISVPQSYPYNPDPIDTYYRPGPAEIASLFPGYPILEACSLRCGSYWEDLENYQEIAKAVIGSTLLRGGLEASKARIHRLLWLFRRYRASVVALRKPDQCVGVASEPIRTGANMLAPLASNETNRDNPRA